MRNPARRRYGQPVTHTVAAGRPPVTSRAELERIAFGLFTERGFDETTVEDIARSAGIGRRTIFRYYASKNDIVWGDWNASLDRLRATLEAAPPGRPLAEVLRAAVVAYNVFDPTDEPRHRRRMELILHVPTLQAHSTLRYAEWRQVIAAYVARRRNEPVDALAPQLLGYATLGAAVAAYEQWLATPAVRSDLPGLLDRALSLLAGWAQD